MLQRFHQPIDDDLARRHVVVAGMRDELGEARGFVARVATRVAGCEVLGVARDRVAIAGDQLGKIILNGITGGRHR